jgi:hypothetical protein
MSSQSLISEKVKARQNPYLVLELEEVPDEATNESVFERKRAYFVKLQEPAAYGDLFGDDDEPPAQTASLARGLQTPSAIVVAEDLVDGTAISRGRLEELLDEVLNLYKPYVAREDWTQVKGFRLEFLDVASRTPASARRVAERLQTLKFSLSPDEKVEFNRAPADGIINKLKQLLV